IGVKRRRNRIGSVELRQSRSGCRAVWKRICIEKRTGSGGSLLPCQDVRNDRLLSEWLAQAKALVREEEERPVPQDRAGEDTPEIILLLVGFLQTIEVCEPAIRIQYAIPEVFEQCAMKSIRSRAGHN